MNKNTRKIKVGVIGLGGRGKCLIRIMQEMEQFEVIGVCDVYDDRVSETVDMFNIDQRPAAYSDYQKLLANPSIDTVVIATTWITHARIAIDAMLAGKNVGLEVGPAASIQECWELVRTVEHTGRTFMFLENICYARKHLAVLNMHKQGIFGELIHCRCGYAHDLRDEVALGFENRHGRLPNYLNRNGEFYPTHGLGPISKILNIGRGNRFLTLSSHSTKARGVAKWVAENKGPDHPLAKAAYTQGDIVTTTLTCAHGETVLITHDTTLPRPGSYQNWVQGTKGVWSEDLDKVYLDGKSPNHKWENFEPYLEVYEHPLWKKYFAEGVRTLGHGGTDHLTISAFADAVLSGNSPVNVYDGATWMAITCLSEDSIAMGGAPVPIPDFTNGQWIDPPPTLESPYSLDQVCYE